MKSGGHSFLNISKTYNHFRLKLVHRPAFTIVELLVVVVVIGVLAAVTLVSFSGITQRAVVVSLQSDLASASRQIKLYQAENGNYPTSIDCSPTPPVGSICIKFSSENIYTTMGFSDAFDDQSFCLAVKNGNVRYYINNDSAPVPGTCAGITSGLVAYYPFDNDTNDYSGNGNDGAIYGGSNLTSGIISQGYSFDGVNGNMETPSDSSLNFGLGSFTISFWVNHRDYAYPKTFGAIKKSNPSAYSAGGIGWDFGHGYKSTGVDVAINDGVNSIRSTLAFDVGSRPPDLLNKWAHVIYIVDRDLDRVSAYVNGVKQSNEINISSVTGVIDNNSTLKIATMYGWNVDGVMDDMRIYNRALSVEDIAILYNL